MPVIPIIAGKSESLFRTVTENGHEIIELLDSDNEMGLQVQAADTISDSEDRDKGVTRSSDTLVADDIEMDSNHDEDDSDDADRAHRIPTVTQTQTMTNQLLRTGSMTAFCQLSAGSYQDYEAMHSGRCGVYF